MLPAQRVSFVQDLQLQLKCGCMQGVEPAVVTNDVMLVFTKAAVIPEPSDVFGDLGFACHDSATIATGAQILRRIKTEAAGVTQGARSTSVVACSVSLCGVFDDAEPVPPRDLQDPIH